ncbi:hypothetical protein TELCIR_07246 [Teladorsagia circumcincta]|uniref:DRBM domain-containing protein n=1 Tax=Teladorsagia circumcincta TaxID=45464 RepID=A0A2G9UL57_TELCI|nr:hypothetical protein TELCIR_07246 [Teladorsagia circumcincta]
MVPPTSRSGPVFPVPTPTGERICMVSVAIGPGLMFTGIGNTFALAKANAAAQCLGFLGPHIQALDAKLKMDEQKRKNAQQKSSSQLTDSVSTNGTGAEESSDQVETTGESDALPKHKQKSVISQVHECALQMKLNVEFEVVVETVGEGRKKKEATQSACANVLSRLRGIGCQIVAVPENSPLFIASSLYKLQKRVLNPSREPKRKTIIKEGLLSVPHRIGLNEDVFHVKIDFRALCVDDQNNQQAARADATYSPSNDAESDDSKYPEPELAPLKADVLVEGRVKRIRRTKEAKRALSDDQKCEIREIARVSIQALQSPNMIPCAEGGPDLESCQLLSARRRLDSMSETFKFSVQYTNFPKSPDESDPLYFALVSLGLERPIVCHGRGSTMEAAAENAAFNAISNLCTYDQPVSPQEQQLGALSPS